MEHLAAQGVTCPQPVRGQDGSALRMLAGRHAAITTFLPGVWPRRPQIAHCAPLGVALARLHAAGESYAPRRVNGLGPSGWRPLLERSLGRADEVAPDLSAELSRVLDRLLRDWPHGLPEGQIHADLFPDNVFFLGHQISGLIDFYFAATDLLAYDLAICLNAWCFEQDGAFNVTRGRALISGYQSVRPLSEAEAEAMAILAQGAALRFLLTRLYDWLNTPAGALVTPKDPIEYLRKLRFHGHARGLSAYVG
jgi:homoserine kinase type II